MRQSSLNVLGAREFGRHRNTGAELIVGKNRRFRLVKRLMDKFVKQADVTRWGPWGVERRISADTVRHHLLLQGRVFQTVARLARRPLLPGPTFDTLRVVQQVRHMKVDKLKQLIKCGFNVLDMVHQSIFLSNIRKIAQGHRQLVFTEMKFKEALCGVGKFKQHIRRSTQAMLAYWGRRGILVCITMSFTGGRAHSLLSILDNTTGWGDRPSSEFRCSCSSPAPPSSFLHPKWAKEIGWDSF